MSQPWSALTLRANGHANIITCEVQVGTPAVGTGAVKELPFKAVWDTGASASVITAKVAADLGLAPTGVTQVNTANGARTSNVFLVDIGLPNGVRARNIQVTDGDITGANVLIGMDIIGAGDFSITNVNGMTVMSYRYPSMKEIDYVQEHQRIQLLGSSTRKDRRAATLADRRAGKKKGFRA